MKFNKPRNKKEEAEFNYIEFINLYKAGFTDGYNKATKKKVKWKDIYQFAGKGWEKRFKGLMK